MVDALSVDHRHGWTRTVRFYFEGAEYEYALDVPLMEEPSARARLYGPNAQAEVRGVFLRQVLLDTRRPH